MIRTEGLIVRLENGERVEELLSIRCVNERAFGGKEEADLVDKLRSDGDALLSMVAELKDQTVGHILFSRMWIDTGAASISAVALAPVAVLPEHQKNGIGADLIHRSLDLLRDRGEEIVIVVGHPTYYPRFGFSTAKARSLENPFPAEAFMAMELSPGALDNVRGKVRYPPAFGL
jgi:putative acetyltransferase